MQPRKTEHNQETFNAFKSLNTRKNINLALLTLYTNSYKIINPKL